MPAAPAILRLVRRLRNPAAMMGFVCTLWLNLALLPPRGSIASDMRDAFAGRTRCLRFADTYVVLLDQPGLRVVSPLTDDSMGDAFSMVDSAPGRATRAIHMTGFPRGALWAPAVAHTDESISFVDDTSGFTRDELDRARQLIAGDLARAGYLNPSLVPELAAGDLHRSSIRWSGVFLNVAAFLSALGLANSLAWMRRGSTWRRARRLRMNLCPACRYCIEGNLSGICPECGETIPTSPAAPAPR
jgi:hypothetical protein